jgi:predicted ATPase
MMAPIWQIGVFGGLRAAGCGRELTRFRTRKTGVLLGYLCLYPERAHARDELAELLWPGCGTQDGRSSLSTALWSLRRQLTPSDRPDAPVLLVDRFTVAINPEVIETDADRFRRQVRLAARAATEAARCAALAEAVDLYRGEVLAGYDEDWLQAARREYEQRYRAALGDLLAGLIAGGQRALARRYLAQAVQLVAAEGLQPLLAELADDEPLAPPVAASQPPPALPLPEGTVTFLVAAAGETRDLPPRLALEIHRHQGRAVSAADPWVAAFGCAEDALACALALQATDTAGLRVALDTGRGVLEQGRYFAPALAQAGQLLGATRPHQTICSERTAALIKLQFDPRLRLADLGSFRIAGAAQAERLFQVEQAGAPSAGVQPPLGLVRDGGNLPRPCTRYFGQEDLLAELAARLTVGQDRLLTLLGPGGSGKTRLALELCARLAEAFQGAVWFVPLVDIAAPEFVMPALLRMLGLPERQDLDPLQQVAASLGRRPALVLFDNAEHLLPECGRHLAALAASGQTIRCLVTSRYRLGVEGEAVVPLGPLPLPEPDCAPAEMVRCASVGLFVDRAQAVVPDFQLTRANAAEVAGLCRRLDGFPLAIELAAAKMATHTPEQLLVQLDRRLELVAARRDQRPARHRSLRLAIGGSVDQLPPEVRRFLLRLAVFRGGWDLPAATAVGDDELAADHLAQLADLSLVTVAVLPCARRFSLLEPLREYAWEQLPTAERDAAERRHAEHYAALSREAGLHLGGESAAEWFARLDSELPNIRAAMAWLIDRRPEVAVASRCGLTHYFDIRGAWHEGRLWLERALAVLPAEATELHHQASLDLGWFNYLLGDNDAARALTAVHTAACRRSGNRNDLCRSLYQASVVARAQGRLDHAEADLLEAAALARTADGCSILPAILHALARHAEEQSDYPRALTLLDEALGIERDHGSRRGLANVLNRRAELAAALGDLDDARRLHEEAHAIYLEVGDRLALASYGLVFGELSRRQGDPVEAERQFLAASTALRELGHLKGVASAHQALARLAAGTGDRRAARLHLAECLRLNQQLGDQDGLATALAALAAVEADEDPAAAVRALAMARRVGDDSDDPRLPGLRQRLGEPAFDAAWSAGWAAAECYLPEPEGA